MIRSRFIAVVLVGAGLGLAAGAAGLTGCTVQGQVATGAYVAGPNLAYIGPDLYVVADYDQPVFFTDGSYWLFRDGLWYRSGAWGRGWVVAGRVPIAVAHINRPQYYVHYHARQVYRPAQIQERDHRSHHEYVEVQGHPREQQREYRQQQQQQQQREYQQRQQQQRQRQQQQQHEHEHHEGNPQRDHREEHR